MRAVVLWISALLFAASPALALEEFRYTESLKLDVGAEPDVEIETVSGDVSYTGIDGNTATVDVLVVVTAKNQEEADRIYDKLELEIEATDGLLIAHIKDADRFYRWLNKLSGRQRQCDVHFNVHGPRGARGSIASISGNAEAREIKDRFRVETVSGDALAYAMTGGLDISSVSGNVTARNCFGPVDAGTVSGDLRVDSCDGTLVAESVSGEITARWIESDTDAETISGDVDITDANGSVNVETVSGYVRIDQKSGGFKLSTTSGDITVHSSGNGPQLHANSISGSVTVAVDSSVVGDVILESNSGSIEADVPLRVQRHSDDRLVGRMGDGDAVLKVTTVSGAIRLRGLP